MLRNWLNKLPSPALSLSRDSSPSVSPRGSRFQAYNPRSFNIRGVCHIQSYYVNEARWDLTIETSARNIQHDVLSPSTTVVALPTDDSATADSTLPSPGPSPDTRSRKRRRTETEDKDRCPKRRKLDEQAHARPQNGISREAFKILQLPRNIRGKSFLCLRCGHAPTYRRCALDCYNAFRAEHFDTAAAKLQIRRTEAGAHETGLGVFLRPGETIAEGTWLGEYLGELLPKEAPEADTSDYAFTLPGDGRRRFDDVIIDGARRGNWTRFVNSSCNPNVEATAEQVGTVRIVALSAKRNIRPGEQLLICYGRTYFAERGTSCRCDAEPWPHLPPEEEIHVSAQAFFSDLRE